MSAASTAGSFWQSVDEGWPLDASATSAAARREGPRLLRAKSSPRPPSGSVRRGRAMPVVQKDVAFRGGRPTTPRRALERA
eukprot:7319238-Lingulodinium_polyedra.AAC.1